MWSCYHHSHPFEWPLEYHSEINHQLVLHSSVVPGFLIHILCNQSLLNSILLSYLLLFNSSSDALDIQWRVKEKSYPLASFYHAVLNENKFYCSPDLLQWPIAIYTIIIQFASFSKSKSSSWLFLISHISVNWTILSHFVELNSVPSFTAS